jgi:hypothetical protein
MAMKDMTMDSEPKQRRAPSMIWPIAIGIGTTMVAGGFAGYNEAAAEHGDAIVAPWIGAVVAIALGAAAMTFYVRRHAEWFKGWSPRKRLYWISLFLAGALGLASAMALQSSGVDGASLIGNDALPANVAIGVSMLWVIGLSVSLVIYHRSIDDHERQAYRIAGLAGFYAFVFSCPAWWLLARADLAPPVDAMILFAVSLAANAITYFWFKFR